MENSIKNCKKEQYERKSDRELLLLMRQGDLQVVDYILEKYKPLVRQKARAMFLLGGENEDLIQEGMIGLFKAIQDYDAEKTESFAVFAKLCISRQMYSAITASRRKKHMPLNSYVSLYEPGESKRDETALIDRLEGDRLQNPEEFFLGQEYLQSVWVTLQERLSEMEKRVLCLQLTGMDYQTIGHMLDKPAKAIDNALQRIRQKAQKIMQEERV